MRESALCEPCPPPPAYCPPCPSDHNSFLMLGIGLVPSIVVSVIVYFLIKKSSK